LKFSGALKSIVDHLATDLIEHTSRQIAATGAATVDDVRRQKKRLAGFSGGAATQTAGLKKFLHTHIYSHPAIVEDRERSVIALDALFRFYMENPGRMPPSYSELAKPDAVNTEPRHRVVCDYIAGMTDHYLLRQCHELLGSKTD
jgi:dGTPase